MAKSPTHKARARRSSRVSIATKTKDSGFIVATYPVAKTTVPYSVLLLLLCVFTIMSEVAYVKWNS